MTNLTRAVSALERKVDSDGHLRLDKEQARALIFLLWDIVNGDDERFAALDLLGTLGEERKEGA